MSSNVELLRQYAREGSETAFTELVRQHMDWVYSAAVRVAGGDRELGEDVAQRVFAELARRAGALAERESITGWLHTCTRYLALAAVRDERRRRTREVEAWVVSEPESGTDWERVRPLLDEAVGRLREGEREAVTLRFFLGKSHREVGAILGMNEDAARKRVERALEKLRVMFARRGVVVPAGALAETVGANAVSAAPAGLAASAAGKALKGGAGAGIVAQAIFMTTQSKMLASALALGLVVLALAGQVAENGELRAELAAAQADNAQGLKEQAQWRAREVKLEGQMSAQQNSAAASAPAGSANAAPAPPPPPPGNRQRALRRNVEIDYADLIKHYNFSPSDKETFIELLMDKESVTDESAGGKRTPEESDDLDWVNGEILAFFDDDADYDYYRQYADQQQERNKLATLDVGLDRIGQPLSDDQREALLNAMYQARKDANLPEDALPTNVVTARQGPIAEKAAAILTPAQMEVLQKNQADERQMTRLSEAAKAEMSGGGP